MAGLLLWAGVALEAAILGGVILRGHWKRIVTLPPLLVALATSATLVGACPSCNTWDFWLVKELLHGVLFLALGVELAVRIFGDRPRTRRVAYAWVAFVLLGLGALLLTAPDRPRMVEALPRIAASIAWLYAGLALLMWPLSRREPFELDDVHAALLLGFAVYTMFYAATWRRTGDDVTIANIANPLVFDVVMVLVARAAWRPPPPVIAPPGA